MPTLLAIFGGPADIIIVLLVAGLLLIRWQRDRQAYLLQKAAIEKGLSILPTGAPLWLASLKKGITVLALGGGMLLAGSLGLQMVSHIPEPPRPAGLSSDTNPRPDSPRPPRPEDRPRDDRPDFRTSPPADFRGPDGRFPPPRLDDRPGDRPNDDRPNPAPPRRGPDPAWDKFRQAQDQRMICFGLLAAGGILSIVGLVLTTFAFVERRVLAPSSSPPP